MTTYNTYQEAKVANPDKEIIRFDKQDEFKAVGNDELSAYLTTWTKCNPADHCMTVEKFLADGYELRENDLILNSVGSVICMDYPSSLGDFGVLNICSEKEHILRAAALETKEPKRTKVEYVEAVFDSAWEAIKSYEINDDLYYCASSTPTYEKMKAGNMKNLLDYSMPVKLYRKIETPIEWWEDASEFVKPTGHSEIVNGQLLVEAAMTRDQWCDFARILLEQGE